MKRSELLYVMSLGRGGMPGAFAMRNRWYVHHGWSDAARAARHADFVVLVATLGGLGDVVVTDADAASAVARFARTPEEIARTLARVRAGAGALEGEALAAGPVPFESIVLVGVANEPARESVRELLAAHGRRDVRVALSPEWLLPEV